MNTVYFPVSTLEELEKLDESEITEGYIDGFKGEPKPSGNRSKSYFHGWRNGMIDRGEIQPDQFSRKLAKEYVSKLRKN